MPERRKNMTEKDWEKWGKEMGKKWADKWGDPEKWERKAHRGKVGFGLFLLVVGVFWMLKDMGLIPALPLWPLILIFFALFIILLKI